MSSSWIFAHSKQIRNKALKAANKAHDNILTATSEYYTDDETLKQACKKAYDDTYAATLRNACYEYKQILEISDMLETVNKEVHPPKDKSEQWYFITIRPDSKVAKFNDFYEIMKKYTDRKMFLEFSLFFEQKGESNETLGEGFHAHLIANTTVKCWAECMRNTESTFKHWLNKKLLTANNIDIKVANNPEGIIEGYCTEYKHKDGHKQATKEWDEKWRQAIGIESRYNGMLPSRKSLVNKPSTTKDFSRQLQVIANPHITFQ